MGYFEWNYVVLISFKKSYFGSFNKLKSSARGTGHRRRQGDCFSGFAVLGYSWWCVAELLWYHFKKNKCVWLGTVGELLPEWFYFLIMEFSIFTQIKYLDLKVLLATPSDGNFSVVALLILDLHNSDTSSRWMFSLSVRSFWGDGEIEGKLRRRDKSSYGRSTKKL